MTEINKKIQNIILDQNTTKYQKLSDILKLIIDYCSIDNNKYSHAHLCIYMYIYVRVCEYISM